MAVKGASCPAKSAARPQAKRAAPGDPHQLCTSPCSQPPLDKRTIIYTDAWHVEEDTIPSIRVRTDYVDPDRNIEGREGGILSAEVERLRQRVELQAVLRALQQLVAQDEEEVQRQLSVVTVYFYPLVFVHHTKGLQKPVLSVSCFFFFGVRRVWKKKT